MRTTLMLMMTMAFSLLGNLQANAQDQPEQHRSRDHAGEAPKDSQRPDAGKHRRGSLMRALDTDGNGELSAEEMDNAPAVLKSLDSNNDNKLTRDDFPDRPQSPSRGARRQRGDADGDDSERPASRSKRGRPDADRGPGGHRGHDADRGPGGHGRRGPDADRERGGHRGHDADRERDGRRGPDADRERGGHGRRGPDADRERGGRRGPDADREPGGRDGAFPDKIIKRFDDNEDGKLQVDELKGRAAQRLSGADKDNDGVLSTEELSAHQSEMRAKHQRPGSDDQEPSPPKEE